MAICRSTHEELVQTHRRLVLMFTNAQTLKMQRGDDDESGIKASLALLSDQICDAKPLSLAQRDYPLVKYWDRKIWKTLAGSKKDTSEVETKGSSCGGTRSSMGENVMMLYIEDASGTPIDGNTASGIREFARSIWRSFYERGIAPETWGQATKEVREEYWREMENEYHVLRFCNNHWKANAIATSIYSQWYRTYDKKMNPHPNNDNDREGNNSNGDGNDGNNDDAGNRSEGPPRKKPKTTITLDNDTHLSLPEPGTHADNEGPLS